MQIGPQPRGILGAKQWVAGESVREGQLVFNNGNVYRVKQNIANPQAGPNATNAFYLRLPVAEDLVYQLVGTPSDYNVSLGPLASTSPLPAIAYYNAFGRNVTRCTFGNSFTNNTIGNNNDQHTIGTGFDNNTFGNGCLGIQFTRGGTHNRIGNAVQTVRAGDFCSYNTLADGVSYITLGNNVRSCLVGIGCSYVAIGAGCERVELYNCTGTAGSNFTIQPGSKDQVWRNNVLVGTGTGTPGTGTARDPLAVGDVASITDAVLDLSNTWVDGDLTAYGSPALQAAGAPPAEAGQNTSILVGTADVATMDEFDKRDANGFAWRCRYSRRNDGTSGWTRLGKTA